MNILEEIADRTRERIGKEKQQVSLETVRTEAENLAKKTEPFRFEKALRASELSFICEVKKASPSKGIIAEDFPYLQIAKEYEKAGADAISCLTEPFYFQGRDSYLREIAQEVCIPILRKDFTVDEYMIYQAKTLGASAVLLICSLLDGEQLKAYHDLADELGLSALVEAHTEDEVKMADRAGARIIGVNNRNLKTFEVDVENSLRLRACADEKTIFVSESGIKTPEEIQKLRENGTDAVLIGETLMRAKDKAEMLRMLAGR
ncbi:MAG: indole-3-glycerol phosphate synthase TrpC [Lachnospiraceae bacterium]|nr:indole-3-glycerol phosphate synthase TrpC [Robinsoniella sp.]MDY3766606.1 indole-3-glycerol phosphate synthase TrpC [Lachnospiraceae bacterium]